MFKKKYLYALISIPGIVLAIWSLSSNTIYDDKACDLKKIAVKGKIMRVVQNHELVFFIDTISRSFPFHFDFNTDSNRNIIGISKGELYPLPMVGDSIEKKAGSKYVKFKRGNKIFSEAIRLNKCDCN